MVLVIVGVDGGWAGLVSPDLASSHHVSPLKKKAYTFLYTEYSTIESELSVASVLVNYF